MMAGKVCIVTGASSGIGKETARGLLRLGATVVLACRDPARGEAARADVTQGIPGANAAVMRLDLASLASIREFARAFLETYPRLDVLVNNAGVSSKTRTVTGDGFETTFQVNYLGHFLLTELLLDRLKASAPSRIVNVGSEVHRWARLDLDDLQWGRGYRQMRAYGSSKLEMTLFTYELARRLDGNRVTANVVHPGFIRTNLGMADAGSGFRFVRRFIKGPDVGAQASLYAATSPDLESVSGKYMTRNGEKESSARSRDAELARRLWDLSEGLLAAGRPSV